MIQNHVTKGAGENAKLCVLTHGELFLYSPVRIDLNLESLEFSDFPDMPGHVPYIFILFWGYNEL